jgi:hypothetical protein
MTRCFFLNVSFAVLTSKFGIHELGGIRRRDMLGHSDHDRGTVCIFSKGLMGTGFRTDTKNANRHLRHGKWRKNYSFIFPICLENLNRGSILRRKLSAGNRNLTRCQRSAWYVSNPPLLVLKYSRFHRHLAWSQCQRYR